MLMYEVYYRDYKTRETDKIAILVERREGIRLDKMF